MILIPFLFIVAVVPHYVSLVPRGRGRMGEKMGEDFAFEFQFCIILHNFATLYDFDTFSIYRGCSASLRFTRPPRTGEDGVEDGRRLCVWISSLYNFASFSTLYDFDAFSWYRGCIASLRFTRPSRTGDDRVEDGRRHCIWISILYNYSKFCDSLWFGTFSWYRGCIASWRFTPPSRTGDDGVEDGRRLCVWKPILYDCAYFFNTLWFWYLFLIAWLYCLIMLVEDGRRWEKALRLYFNSKSFCIFLQHSMILIPFLDIVAVLPHYVSLVPRGRGTIG